MGTGPRSPGPAAQLRSPVRPRPGGRRGWSPDALSAAWQLTGSLQPSLGVARRVVVTYLELGCGERTLGWGEQIDACDPGSLAHQRLGEGCVSARRRQEPPTPWTEGCRWGTVQQVRDPDASPARLPRAGRTTLRSFGTSWLYGNCKGFQVRRGPLLCWGYLSGPTVGPRVGVRFRGDPVVMEGDCLRRCQFLIEREGIGSSPPERIRPSRSPHSVRLGPWPR